MDQAVGVRADGTPMSQQEVDAHNAELERATAEGMPDGGRIETDEATMTQAACNDAEYHGYTPPLVRLFEPRHELAEHAVWIARELIASTPQPYREPRQSAAFAVCIAKEIHRLVYGEPAKEDSAGA